MTQDKTRIPSHKDMPSTRAYCTPNACTPKPRNIYRSSPVSKCSGGMSNGEPLVDRSKIESLMYLTSSRPDLVQAVCYCARCQARPIQKHLKEVKRIFKYLKGTINMGLWYPKDYGFELTAFSDADHAGCLDTRKSTSGCQRNKTALQCLQQRQSTWHYLQVVL
ncbi:hypothetical protein Tco_0225087, partial [Tanacetum coccineum]